MKAKFPVSSFQFQRSRNACSGVALIGIIIMIIVMGMLGGSVLMLITTSSMESLQAMSWSKAFFAAESGISKGKEYIATNASYQDNLPWTMTGMIGQASFEIVITTNAATNVVVSSTGIYGDPPSRWTSIWRPTEILRAIIVYKQTTLAVPRYRTCFEGGRLSDEFTANPVSTRIRWQRIEANPRTNEFLLVTEDNNRRVYAQTYLNGSWVSNTWLNRSGVPSSAATRSFDVAYENLSGRGMVVYSINTTNPQYCVWTSTGWSSPPGSINVGANGPISWIRLISKPGTNEIMCLARWDKNTGPAWSRGRYSSAIIWNGTTWTNYVPLERQCASQIGYETFDAAYSTNLALVVYINGPTTDEPKYRTYTSTSGVWSAEQTNTTLGAVPRWIRVEYSVKGPTNRPLAAYAAFLDDGGKLQGAYYTNALNWTAYNNFSNVNIETSAMRAFDIAWSSQDDALMVVYSRLNQNAQSYMLVANAESPGSPECSTNYGSLASTDVGQWCVLKADPFTSEFYYLAQDDRSDVNFQRWTGTAWNLLDPELEDNTSDNNYNFTDFTFRKDSAAKP